MNGSFKMIKVEWIDAETSGDVSWQNLEETRVEAAKPPPTMSTIGWLLYESSTHIALVDTVGSEDCSMMHKIPRVMITAISKLTVEPY